VNGSSLNLPSYPPDNHQCSKMADGEEGDKISEKYSALLKILTLLMQLLCHNAVAMSDC